MLNVKAARQHLHELQVKGREFLAKAKEEDRDLTEEEETEWSEIEKSIEAAKADVAKAERARDRLAALESVDMEVDDETQIDGGTPAGAKGNNPWPTFGHQMAAIAEAYRPGGKVDPLLNVPDPKAAPQGLGTHQGGEGGFLVRNEFSSEIFMKAHEESELFNRCDEVPIGEGFDGLEVPYVDEQSRANGSRWGGVTVERVNQGDTATASRPKFGLHETRLEDLMGLAYATERALRDAVSLGAVLQSAFTEEMAFTLDGEIFEGTGAGECLGFTNADCFVSVAKETGQLADTIVFENITKMWSRVHSRSRRRAVWLINQDCEPTLMSMGVVVGVGGVPAYLPPSGLSGTPFATLFGRPVIPIEHSPTVGDANDITVADLSQYVVITKDGVQSAESMHVRFIYNERTFRWVTRVNGQPKWKTALTPKKGSNTLSPFVGLAARA